MKALIFNSGFGSRLGRLTEHNPKSMVNLGNGETIFHRQLRLLTECGITEFIVTTGPFPRQLQEAAQPFIGKGCTVEFVQNDEYAETNYIYSMYLARHLLREGDFLLLHGDLVFDRAFIRKLIGAPGGSLVPVNASLPQPEKDFKARMLDGKIIEVSTKIFDEDCIALQPLYRLTEASMNKWLDSVETFVEAGDTGVYAENAANEVFGEMAVHGFSYEGHFVEEVDTAEDLERVAAGIRLIDFSQQPVYRMVDDSLELIEGEPLGKPSESSDFADLLKDCAARNPLVVCSKRLTTEELCKYLQMAEGEFIRFDEFGPNPAYEQGLKALKAYKENDCDSIVAFGGGSAIDVAKCVKAFAAIPNSGEGGSYLERALSFSGIPLIAIPTTAGTGSESTCFAVLYKDGKKHSLAHDCLLPDAAVLDARHLRSLPDYQKKCTMLDALCQAIESYWSVLSCKESRDYSRRAMEIMVNSASSYLSGSAESAAEISLAANLAGKAINITTTTAAHAMSYKITSLKGIPHGHAVALCLPGCWRHLINAANSDGKIRQTLTEIAFVLGSDAPEKGLEAFERFVGSLCLETKISLSEEEIESLVSSVNVERLANFPMALSSEEIKSIYEGIRKPVKAGQVQ